MAQLASLETSGDTAARTLRAFSYIVARDFGFAPNPFHGWCTLATCKPDIRRVATVGDLVLGTGSAGHRRTGFAVYAMRVDEVLSFAEYWEDPRFTPKRPNLAGSRKLAFGDNIYRPGRSGGWVQLDSHHSFHDGSPNPENVNRDTRTNRVLIGLDFVYWGGSGPLIPKYLRAFGEDEEDLCTSTQGHKSRFSDELIAAAVDWFEGFTERGFQGRPDQWSQDK